MPNIPNIKDFPEIDTEIEKLPFFLELKDLYVEDSTRQLAALREAFIKGDAEALKSSAHMLKGSSQTFGAKRLARLCEALEMLGRNGSVDGAKTLLALLENAFEELKTQLSESSK